MSTRCSVLIRLKESDRNTDLVQDRRLLSAAGIKNYAPVQDNVPVRTSKEYAGIYCHHDGYPSHMGKTLTGKFSTYEMAKALVLGGDTSWIQEDSVGYYTNNGEAKNIRFTDDIHPVSADSEYVYVFDPDDGRWRYCKVGIDWKHPEVAVISPDEMVEIPEEYDMTRKIRLTANPDSNPGI